MSLSRLPSDWPHRAASEIVRAGGIDWHLQRLGSGPVLLLIHGTAASTHSFRDLAEALSGEFEIVMADLPGHGFTGAMDAPSLPRVAQALGALLQRIGAEPVAAAGHSAGAAVAVRMTLDGNIAPQSLIGLAPALQPYGGSDEGLASKVMKWALLNPLAARLFAMRANSDRVGKLIAKTGSHLDEQGVDYYTRLLKRPEHVEGALRLMAHWKLQPLLDDLGNLKTPLHLLAGEDDRAVPPRSVEVAARRVRDCKLVRLAGLGHLAHEEDPGAAAQLVRGAVQAARPAGSVSGSDRPRAGARP